MTKDVLVSISGMQHDVESEAIELVVPGDYYIKNDKHYVLFEEQPDETASVTKNIVKFNTDFFELTKKGGNNSFLRFDKDKKNSSIYQTPVGPIQLDVLTKELHLEETDNAISVKVKYDLDINFQFVSTCEVDFRIQTRE